jgi:hypothetical protein
MDSKVMVFNSHEIEGKTSGSSAINFKHSVLMRRKNIRLPDNTIITPGTLVYFKEDIGQAVKGELGRVSKILENETHVDSLRGYITVVPDTKIEVVGSVRTDIRAIRVVPIDSD